MDKKEFYDRVVIALCHGPLAAQSFSGPPLDLAEQIAGVAESLVEHRDQFLAKQPIGYAPNPEK